MKMQLRLGFILVMTLVAVSVFGGGFDTRRLGVEGAGTMNSAGSFAHNDGHDEMDYGFNVGVCYKLKNRHGWFFEPTVGFSYGDYEFYHSDATFRTSLTSIELPIKFGHDFNLGFLDMTVSPLICVKPVFALGGRLMVGGMRYHWNPFNVAAGFGFGLLFEEKWGLNIRGDFNLLKSIHDLPESTGISNHNGVIYITLKYYF